MSKSKYKYERNEANLRLNTREREKIEQVRSTLSEKLGTKVTQKTLIEAIIDIAYEGYDLRGVMNYA